MHRKSLLFSFKASPVEKCGITGRVKGIESGKRYERGPTRSFLLLGLEVVEQDGALLRLLTPVLDDDA